MALSPTALTTVAAVEVASTTAWVDARVEQVINAVSAAVERYCGRNFGYRALTTDNPEYYRGTGRVDLFVRRWPIIEMTRVRISGTAVTDYELTDDMMAEGRIFRLSGWPIVAGGYGDLTQDRDLSQQSEPIDLVYAGGYILPQWGGVQDADHNPDNEDRNLPYDLEEAVIRACNEVLSRPMAGLTAETTPGGWRREWGKTSSGNATQSVGMFSAEVRAMLDPYRSRWFA